MLKQISKNWQNKSFQFYMVDNEANSQIQIILKESHPFISITTSCWEMLNGSTIENCWKFNNKEFDIKKENYIEFFRMMLSPAYKQNGFEDFQCSRYDTSFGITIFNTMFLEHNGNKKKYHTLACFLDSKYIKTSSYINDLIYQRMHFLGLKYQKFKIAKELEKDQLTIIIREIALECTSIFLCGFNEIKTDLPKLNNTNFYSQCLTAHLQTQMTTVIETPDMKSCEELFSLLSNFLIDEQRNLSSQTINNRPIPGLFLQCVKTQQAIPVQSLFQFQRPWTWINVTNKTVMCFSDFEIQQIIYKDYTANFLFSNNINEQKVNSMFQKYVNYYRDNQIAPSKFTDDIIKNLIKINAKMFKYYCSQKVLELIQRAIILIDMCNEILVSTKKNLLNSNEINIICQNMDIQERNELKIIVSISQLFNKHVHHYFFSKRKETIQQMISCI